jgi:hypothetical protein
MRTRITGAALVTAGMVATIMLRALVMAPPANHPAAVTELLLAAFIVLVGLPGLASLVEGPALFGTADSPPQRRSPRDRTPPL